MESPEVAQVCLTSLQVSLVSTALLSLPAIGLGWLLARKRFPGRTLLRSMVLLPMVLPPVAVGFFLLSLLSKERAFGEWVEALFGGSLLLTWKAAVLAAAAMSFPLAVLGAERGFDSVPRRLEKVAASLGATPWRVFRTVTLPLARRGILHGLVFAMVRATGEFGATALLAGNVPGRTQTLSMAIFARVEDFRDREAFELSALAFLFALVLTLGAERLLREPSSTAL